MQRNLTLFRNTTIKKNIVDGWISSGFVDDDAFSSFSTSETHSGAFLREKKENEVDVKIAYHAKKGENRTAPPYRILDGKFIGYSEECEYTGRPGKFKIKKWQNRRNLFIFCHFEVLYYFFSVGIF